MVEIELSERYSSSIFFYYLTAVSSDCADIDGNNKMTKRAVARKNLYMLNPFYYRFCFVLG